MWDTDTRPWQGVSCTSSELIHSFFPEWQEEFQPGVYNPLLRPCSPAIFLREKSHFPCLIHNFDISTSMLMYICQELLKFSIYLKLKKNINKSYYEFISPKLQQMNNQSLHDTPVHFLSAPKVCIARPRRDKFHSSPLTNQLICIMFQET